MLRRPAHNLHSLCYNVSMHSRYVLTFLYTNLDLNYFKLSHRQATVFSLAGFCREQYHRLFHFHIFNKCLEVQGGHAQDL